MSKRIFVWISVIGVAGFAQLRAQEFRRLNFNFGGGISTPLNPTGQYTGVSGNVNAGAGYNLNNKNSISGEFMWSGLPTALTALHPISAPSGSINLYTLTANYRHHIDSIQGSAFGVYAIAGGGWYYRYSSIDQKWVVPPGTACAPYWYWYGYACDPNGYVYSQTVAYRGVSAGGLNGGAGFTLRFADSGWKFYAEARYHYAFSQRVATTVIPVTFGIRYN